jgi:cobalt-precorrin 5A hydrolase/precorrin-3B C17-methyltransferase
VSRIVSCSVTAAGASLAEQLPYEHRRGRLVPTVTELWSLVDGFVLICPTGVAVRAVGPLLSDKATDPAVVVVDDAGRFAVSLLGGHSRDANGLAARVAALIGANPVVTTGTDATGRPGLDTLAGWQADGDVARVTRRWLDGHLPTVATDAELAGWPLPAALADLPRDVRRASVVVTDSVQVPGPGRVALRPRSLVVGVGSSAGADPVGMVELVGAALAAAGRHPHAVGVVATLDRKAGEPAIVALAEQLGAQLVTFPADALADVDVPTPSAAVAAAVGTKSVAEAAALLAAGSGGTLVVTKRSSRDATVAVARRALPAGHLAVVGLGPGDASHRTVAAETAVRHASTVIGYGPYVDLAADLLHSGHRVERSPIGAEEQRCREALRRAAAGDRVALVCSGDAGVYAMASLVCELAPQLGDPPVTVVAGVTAALAAAAELGAPLGHDHAAVSLSDLLTPWEVIATRLEAAAAGDFVVSLYNPRSTRRVTQLRAALTILMGARPASTPAAIVTDVGRPGQRIVPTTLGELDPELVGMSSIVIVGASSTRWIGGRMVTPRGYAT